MDVGEGRDSAEEARRNLWGESYREMGKPYKVTESEVDKD